ncbi:hypothetical protein BN381_250040 [Candidatus Microthrix parvicella RN1]|uniref:Uncharacterized protein n=2 Tax=Candidatus Neomicrothrix TaxID=41949 RepID=R4Z4Q5_9ACTN|nr:hypothetical protein BN381_250040 [Candidatus Microthrix parvicella RN1]
MGTISPWAHRPRSSNSLADHHLAVVAVSHQEPPMIGGDFQATAVPAKCGGALSRI